MLLEDLSNEMKDLSINDSSNQQHERKELLIFFRSANLRHERDKLIETLKLTVDLRQEVLRDKKTQIMQIFPFYFADPTLVHFFPFI